MQALTKKNDSVKCIKCNKIVPTLNLYAQKALNQKNLLYNDWFMQFTAPLKYNSIFKEKKNKFCSARALTHQMDSHGMSWIRELNCKKLGIAF